MTTYYISVAREPVGGYMQFGNIHIGTSFADDIAIAYSTTHTPTRKDIVKACIGLIAYIVGGGPVPLVGADLPVL